LERKLAVNDYLPLLGRDLVLVGGQAVNLWTERYLPKEHSIGMFLPFTSRDADFIQFAVAGEA